MSQLRVGLRVPDVAAAIAFYGGREITCEPMDEAWGERVFTCLDRSCTGGSSRSRSRVRARCRA